MNSTLDRVRARLVTSDSRIADSEAVAVIS
jgi:hypothetical protein